MGAVVHRGGHARSDQGSGARHARGARALALAALLVGSAACGDGAPSVDAARTDARPTAPDAAVSIDAPVSLTWVDLAVEGCASLGQDPVRCTGEVPLDLRFAIIAPAPVDGVLWDFGDGTPSATEVAPRHRYVQPGSYDVTLSVRGPGGTAQVRRTMLVDARAAGLGGACAQDEGCLADLTCLCGGDDATCPAPLARGLCTAACETDDACGPGGACVLVPGAPGASFGGRWCVETCAPDTGCAAGLACAPMVREAAGWVDACFPPGVLLADGASCRDAAGVLRDDVCASGRCLDLGVRGLCASSCVGGCASGTTCATVAGVGVACLARCSASACDGDPWLACESPDASGAHGFTVDGAADPAGYCAPRRCVVDGDCGTGACVERAGARFCGG